MAGLQRIVGTTGATRVEATGVCTAGALTGRGLGFETTERTAEEEEGREVDAGVSPETLPPM